MAASSIAIEELTDCPICTEPFKEPQILPCLHTFCKKCVDKLVKSSHLRCPTCNVTTNVKAIRVDFRVQKIVEALEQAAHLALAKPAVEQSVSSGSSREMCFLCNSHPIAHWCQDCTQWICEPCKCTHLKIPACSQHKLTALAQKRNRAKNALKSKVNRISQIQKKFRDVISAFEAAADDSKSVQVAALQACKDLRELCQNDINLFFDSLQAEIIKFTDNALQDIKAQLQKTEEQLNEIIRQKNAFEDIIAGDDNQVAIEGDILIKKAKEYIETIESPDVKITLPMVKLKRDSKWTQQAASLGLSGGTVTKSQMKGFKLKLCELSDKLWKKEQEEKLPDRPQALRVIQHELWCCCYNSGIVIYDSDLQQQRTIPCGDMGGVFDVAEMSDGTIIIATQKGLYSYEIGSAKSTLIETGSFSSVAIDQDLLCAVRCATSDAAVMMYTHTEGRCDRIVILTHCGHVFAHL